MLFPSRILRVDSYRAARQELRAALFGIKSTIATRSHRQKYNNDVAMQRRVETYLMSNGGIRSRSTIMPEEVRHHLRRNFKFAFLEVEDHISSPLCFAAAKALLMVLIQKAEDLKGAGLEVQTKWLSIARSAASTEEEAQHMEQLTLAVQSRYHMLPAHHHDDSAALVLSAEPNRSPPAVTSSSTVPSIRGGIAALASNEVVSSGRFLSAPNESFLRYYMQQGLVQSEQELLDVVTALRRRPLTVVRVHSSSPFFGVAIETLRREPGFTVPAWASQSIGAVFAMETSGASQHQLVQCRGLLQALLREKVCSMQSASSLLPVIALQVQSGDAVLDLCAAPGSKTMQVLDAAWNGAVPRLVVAVDSSIKRAQELSSRAAGLDTGLVIVSARGECFPSTHGRLFDKILVDAPCSGEGRLHLNASEWRLWHPQRGVAFHETQVALLRHALRQAKIGGTVVYSTCTLNPLENEAVVAAVLIDGGVDVVPIRSWLPSELLDVHCARSGVSTWSVPSPDGGFAKFDEGGMVSTAFAESSPEDVRTRIASAALRVVPLAGRSNEDPWEAFFVIALRKVAPTLFPAAAPARHNLMGSASSSATAGRTTLAPCSSLITGPLNPKQLRLLPPTSVGASSRWLAPFLGRDGNVAMALQQHNFRLVAHSSRRSLPPPGEMNAPHGNEEIWAVSNAASSFVSETAVRDDGAQDKGNRDAVLLSCGVCLFDADGVLTEQGARVLHEGFKFRAQSFVLAVRDALQAVATGSVCLQRNGPSRYESAISQVRNDPSSPSGTDVSTHNIMTHIRNGNAVAVVRLVMNDGRTKDEYCLPVLVEHIEASGDVVVRSVLRGASRRRAIAMINRAQRLESTVEAQLRRRAVENAVDGRASGPHVDAIARGDAATEIATTKEASKQRLLSRLRPPSIAALGKESAALSAPAGTSAREVPVTPASRVPLPSDAVHF